MAVVSAGIPLGLAIAGIFAPEVIAVGGWQGLFVVPGLFAAHARAGAAATARRRAPAGDERPAARGGAKVPQLELFSAPWLFPFAVFAAMLALNALNLYLLNSWLPTVLPQAGFTLDEAARVSGVAQLAGLAIGDRARAC